MTLTPGQQHEMTQAPQLLEHAQGQAFLGDTAYDSNDLAERIERKGMKVVVCQHPKRKYGLRPVDPELYRHRYLERRGRIPGVRVRRGNDRQPPSDRPGRLMRIGLAEPRGPRLKSEAG